MVTQECIDRCNEAPALSASIGTALALYEVDYWIGALERAAKSAQRPLTLIDRSRIEGAITQLTALSGRR